MFRPDCSYAPARRLLSMTLTLAGLLSLFTLPPSTLNSHARTPSPVGAPAPLAAERLKQLSQLPMSFEANRGQTDRRVKFLSRGDGYTLFLTPTEAVISLRRGEHQDPSVLRMRLVGADPRSHVAGQDELPGKVNYFKGGNRAAWSGNVSTYAKVYYRGVYPGVDVVYYGKQRQLEYDFIVAPDGDPGRIQLAFAGARRLFLDEAGDLVLETAAGRVRQQRPVAYQEVDGRRREVSAAYVLKGRRHVGFEVGDYDPSRPLVIDPVIDYSTYLGGGGVEEGDDIAIDAEGKIYVTGWTMSVNFPASVGAYDAVCQRCANWGMDAFVTKIDPSQSGAASLVFSSFLGSGTTGNTESRAVAVDSSNNVYVTGVTTARDFPTTANALEPAYQFMSNTNSFLTKFDATGGSLIYSTYLLGNNVEEGADVDVDAGGNVYVAGRTASTNFRTMNAYQLNNAGMFDAFVMKFAPAVGNNYVLTYSTYLGGNNSDEAGSLALDGAGRVYLTGTTQSADNAGTPLVYEGFPVLNGFQTALAAGGDAFMTKLDPGVGGPASLLYSTYLGGNNHENSIVQSGGIAVDANNMAYVTGTTNSANFPLKNPWDATLGYYDAFVTKIDASLAGNASLVYSTYLGGLAVEMGNDIAVDSVGRAYVTGMTQSNDFPVMCGFANTPSTDAFITVLDAAGSQPVFSTHIGGNGGEAGYAIAVDAFGTAYVTGNTDSSNFPNPGAYQPTLGGTSPGSYFNDAFVTKITPTNCP